MARPHFEPEQTHVSGRRWIAHALDGSEYRQRLGDRWADTYVIDAMPKERREARPGKISLS